MEKKIKRKWKLIGVFLVSFIALSSFMFLCTSGVRPYHTRLFKQHHGGMHKQFHEIEGIFKGHKAFDFAQAMGEKVESYGTYLDANRTCDIFVETNTGLKEDKRNRFEFLKSKVDFDLCRYKDEVGIDVRWLWKYFEKILEVSKIKLKLDPVKEGSCNISPSEVYGWYKNFYPLKGVLWTSYLKPAGTHDKLSAAIVKNEGVDQYYNITNTAAVNLLLKVPFQRKVVVLSMEVSDAFPIDANGQPLKDGETTKIKRAVFSKGVALGHSHGEKESNQMSADPFYIPADSQIQKLKGKPCPFKDRKMNPKSKDAPNNKEQIDKLTKIRLEKLSTRSMKQNDEKKDEKEQPQYNATLVQKNLEDLHKKLEDMAQGDKKNASKLQFLDSVINYIDGQVSKITGKSTQEQGSNNILTSTIINGKPVDTANEPKFRFKPVLFDSKDDGKFYHSDENVQRHGHEHKHAKFGGEHPEILAISEYKAFVFVKGEFGFAAGGGALVETPTGYVKESTGIVKFGFCYDP